ncbi:DUF4169 family protein [Sphingobium sufflavum]|uniref:DUF4169 family protein n=1 Tax=Sphingobium sufflavum TaxID=1129547 RepID=UPI001F368526|nr:DUF4169 family protein [Sphingobium sufflavum]MCE7797941.1 DUF4169 family protein [Sphingobium sufflavum]
MAEIINLRTARKARKRADDATLAEQNRAKFGRTKGEKERDRIEAERLVRRIDGAKREGDA